jgi:hypothetical protein
MRSLIIGVLMATTTASASAAAQTPDARVAATIRRSGARFEVPRALLGPIGESIVCAVSWDRSYQTWRIGDEGVAITVPAESRGTTLTATGFNVRGAGSINVMELVPDTTIHARFEGPVLVIELGMSSTLNGLARIRPDSLRVDLLTPQSREPRAWLYPVYAP